MSDYLLWLDMEMTGLVPDTDRILEVAALLTRADLTPVADGPELVIHQADAVLTAMDAWNQKHHGASGLIDRVRASSTNETAAEDALLAFINSHFAAAVRPVLTGNSIHQDRRFIARHMPRLDARLHYRMVDVSTIKELARRWYPGAFSRMPAKRDRHRALEDIRDSIAELAAYRASIFAAPETSGSASPKLSQ